MKNKRKLKQKFRRKQLLFFMTNGMNQLLLTGSVPIRDWGKKKPKWVSYKLTQDKQVLLQVDPIDEAKWKDWEMAPDKSLDLSYLFEDEEED